MGVDLDKVRAKLNSLNKKSGPKKRITWSAPEGKTVIRIVPNKNNPEFPFEEVFMHYDFGGQTYVSPVTSGDADPIVEFAQELQRKANEQDDKELWKQGKQLEPRPRYFVPILVRGSEKEGVKWWGVGVNLYKELLEYFLDEDYGDISDVTNGRDITVTRSGTGRTDTSYSIKVKPSKSKVTSDKEIAGLIKEQPSVMEIFENNRYQKLATYDELKVALEKWLEGSSEENEEEAEETKPKSKKEKKEKVSATDLKDVEAEFDNLFDD